MNAFARFISPNTKKTKLTRRLTLVFISPFVLTFVLTLLYTCELIKAIATTVVDLAREIIDEYKDDIIELYKQNW